MEKIKIKPVKVKKDLFGQILNYDTPVTTYHNNLRKLYKMTCLQSETKKLYDNINNIKKILETTKKNRKKKHYNDFIKENKEIQKLTIKSKYMTTIRKSVVRYNACSSALVDSAGWKYKYISAFLKAIEIDLKTATEAQKLMYDKLNKYYEGKKEEWKNSGSEGVEIEGDSEENWFKIVVGKDASTISREASCFGGKCESLLDQLGMEKEDNVPRMQICLNKVVWMLNTCYVGNESIWDKYPKLEQDVSKTINEINMTYKNTNSNYIVNFLGSAMYQGLTKRYAVETQKQIEHWLMQALQTVLNMNKWFTDLKISESFENIIKILENNIGDRLKELGLKEFIDKWGDAYEAAHEIILELDSRDYVNITEKKFKKLTLDDFNNGIKIKNKRQKPIGSKIAILNDFEKNTANTSKSFFEQTLYYAPWQQM